MKVRSDAAFTAFLLAVGLGVIGVPTAQAQPVPHDVVVSDNPAGFTPHVLDGQVDAIAVVGNKVILGGQFTRAQNPSGGSELSRVNILAFDRTTGVIDTAFVPVVDGRVRTLAPGPDAQSVYVGGQFNNISGQAASKFARLNINTGQKVAGFANNSFDALVYDAKLVGNRVFVAGQFTKIAGQNRSKLAELDPNTGALRPTGSVLVEGVHASGTTHILKFDTNAAGTQLTAIGNFRTVNGQSRVQIATFDITGPATLMTDWKTTRYEPGCFAGFDYYIRDIDYAPDGSYFATTSTGGYPNAPQTLCDAVVRWNAGDRGQDVQPEWVDHSGGDSYYAVAVTGSAVYVGGHQRWFNNPYASDAPGPGAVSRSGIGAVDPVNGVPLSWNPGRTRGRGVFDMVSTPDGLWVGSDTDRIGNFEYHGRIAFFPTAGGTAVPQPDPASLPVNAYLAGVPGAPDPLNVRSFDGAAAGPTAPADAGPVDWATVRGAFALDGALYLAHADGTLTVGSYDGTSYGARTALNLYGLTQFASELSVMTGLFYIEGRIYFTLSGDPNLYYRYFTVESGITGAVRFTAPSGGIDWSQARGTIFADGSLYANAAATGDLHRVTWTNRAPQAGTDTVVSGPGLDGVDWRANALFALPGTAPNEAPTAAFDADCTGLSCAFDGSGSTDSDGTVDGYGWDFGDGDTGSGQTIGHGYHAAGTYTVTLTVTDNDGATGSTSAQVVVEESASNVSFVGSARHQLNGSQSTQRVTVPAAVAAGDVLVMSMTYNGGAAVTVGDPAGWTRASTVTLSNTTSVIWTRTAVAGSGGSTVSVTASTPVRSSLLVSAYRDAVIPAGGVATAGETVNRAAHTTPAVTVPGGSWVLSMWTDKTAATTAWTPPAGQQVLQTGAGSGAGHISWLMTDSGPLAAGPAGALTAIANSSSAQATMVTVVLAPAP